MRGEEGPRLDAPIAVKSGPKSSGLVVAAGLAYVGMSLACSFVYLDILAPRMTSDLFWLNFSDSVQTHLVQSANSMYWMPRNRTAQLSLTSLALAQDTPHVPLKLTLPRRLLYTQLTDPAVGISTCRTMEPSGWVWLTTNYCWVDFNKTWQVAVTASRQRRCDRYAANGAVYMEAVFRNVQFAALLDSSIQDNAALQGAILNAVMQTSDGRAFVSYLQHFELVSIPDEVVYWATLNVTSWTYQVQNWKLVGMRDAMTLTPATGNGYTVHAVSIASVTKFSSWTTLTMSFPTTYLLEWARILQINLVRSDNHVDDSWLSDNWYVAPTSAQTTAAIHDWLGPLLSIDLYLVSIPEPLQELHWQYHLALNHVRIHDDQWAELFVSIQPLRFVPRMPQWMATTSATVGYLSGSPLCQAFPPSTQDFRREWGFADACTAPVRFSVQVSAKTLLFALISAPSMTHDEWHDVSVAVCAVADNFAKCMAAFRTGLDLVRDVQAQLPTNFLAVLNETRAVLAQDPVEIVQFAVDSASNETAMLRYALLDATDPVMALLSSVFLLEWATGDREVLSFEGDVDTLHLVSYAYPHRQGSEQEAGIRRNIGDVFVMGSTYISLVLAGLAVCMAVTLVARFRVVHGTNIFYFHRVATLTWTGRPLLFLRGAGAAAILCSPSAALVDRNGLTFLEDHPRTFVQSMLVASELTWLSYVLADVFVIWSQGYTRWCAPLSSLAVFVVALIWDVVFPLKASVNVTTNCPEVTFYDNIGCQNYSIAAGSPSRLLCLLGVNVLTLIGGYLVTRGLYFLHASRPRTTPSFVLNTGASVGIFSSVASGQHIGTAWWTDPATNLMNVLFPFQSHGEWYIFDFKSWQLLRMDKNYQHATRQSEVGPTTRTESLAPAVGGPPVIRLQLKLLTAVVIFVAASLVSSVVYLSVLEQKLSNDFWWAGFNTTGGHNFLAQLFQYPSSFHNDEDVDLLQTTYSLPLFDGELNGSASVLFSNLLGPLSLESQPLLGVIADLREMNGCAVPWIATQYCWIDFDQQWALAFSKKRQERCHDMELANAAVYLESILRNVHVAEFRSCWGRAFELAIEAELELSIEGRTWLRDTMRPSDGWTLSLADEARFWTNKYLTRFTTQWQNYKLHGLTEILHVETAVGSTFPLTLKHNPGEWRLNDQTSFKMYWSLANVLWAVQDNATTSALAGRSLVRQSSNFAFQNLTAEQMLVQNGTLEFPPPWSVPLFYNAVGPYGSVDLKRVPVPSDLLQLVRDVPMDVHTSLFNNEAAMAIYNRAPREVDMTMIMPRWDRDYYFFGGSPLCFNNVEGQKYTLNTYFGLTSSCLTFVQEGYYLDPIEAVFATMLGNVSNASAATMCNTFARRANCRVVLDTYPALVASIFGPDAILAYQDRGRGVLDAVVALNISLFQYAVAGNQDNYSTALLLANAFEPDYGMAFWSWSYMYQWAVGLREVISLHGDSGVLRVLSTIDPGVPFTMHPAEIPRSLSLYVLRAMQYVTGMVVLVTGAVLVLVVTSKGRVEPRNLLKVTRVGCIVWIGRPLLVLRAWSAVSLLSTNQLVLSLDSTGSNVKLSTPDDGWVGSIANTIMISGEVCWLSYILHDILSVVAHSHTRFYSSKSNYLLWAAASVLQLAIPLRPTTRLSRTCVQAPFDFHAVCEVGTIAIGSRNRAMTLVGLMVACNVVCFTLEWLRCRRTTTRANPPSLFLYSMGAHTFAFDRWTHGRVLYLDKASAFLNGLVVVQLSGTMYMLDIKTWRTYHMRRPRHMSPTFAACVPLAE